MNITFENNNAWEGINDRAKELIFSYNEGYKEFLNNAKTERECVREAVKIAEKNGFCNMDELIKKGHRVRPNDKLYRVNKDKNIILFVVGKEHISEGMNIIGTHIDCPRLDLKPNPLYEDGDFAYLKTHYYGSIKKYQWVTIPLSIHGIIIKSNGEKINLSIGEGENDPVFCISDILIHLAQKQMQGRLADGITGEQLNIITGSIPAGDSEVKEKIKLFILSYLNETYGICEEDFQSAEIEVVPAMKSKDIGFDRSMVGGYGQDDRVCSYAALNAITQINNPDRTCLCILIDKEETDSVGNTSIKSRFFENTVAELSNMLMESYSELTVRRALENSKMLSGDVIAAYDPGFGEVFEINNSSFTGHGLAIIKYTGARGKYEESDANAEFIAKIRKLFNDNEIVWQSGEYGKVDEGGAGTIAGYAASYNMEVVDCGVPVLSMHSPFEVTSKIDNYMAYKGYYNFFIKMNS